MGIDRRFIFVLCVAVAAACSQPSAPSAVPNAAIRPAPQATQAAPIQYAYAVNYNGNDVSQLALLPKKPYLKAIAPNFKLPSSCTGPDSLAIAKGLSLLFVSCYSGEIVTLGINTKTHVLLPVKLKPVPVASPLYLIAPTSGANGQLYADGYNGQLYQLSYSAKSAQLRNTYTTTSVYPGQMAFYTSPAGASTLYVAAPFDSASCGSSAPSGDIVPWQQNADGSLVEQTAIPACTSAYHVVTAGSNLYWASTSYLGGYSLANNAPLTLPAPPWVATGGGPSYYPDAMAVVASAPKKKRLSSAGLGGGDQFATLGTDGYLTLYDANGAVKERHQLTKPETGKGTVCFTFANGVLIGDKAYTFVCWAIDGDTIKVYAATKDYKTTRLVTAHTGDAPYQVEVAPLHF